MGNAAGCWQLRRPQEQVGRAAASAEQCSKLCAEQSVIMAALQLVQYCAKLPWSYAPRYAGRLAAVSPRAQTQRAPLPAYLAGNGAGC